MYQQPRSEEERAALKLEMRRYKENKEKLRRRKEEARLRRVSASLAPPAMPSALLSCPPGADPDITPPIRKLGKLTDGLPVIVTLKQEGTVDTSPLNDSLLSMNAMLDEEIAAANDDGSPLLSNSIARKCVDELDVLRRPRLARPLTTATITTKITKTTTTAPAAAERSVTMIFFFVYTFVPIKYIYIVNTDIYD